MKTRTLIFILASVFILAACKKEAGPGGKKTIKGTVYYKNGSTGSNSPAAAASVFISYGTKEISSPDQTILSNSDGSYKIEALRKGDYFITASFTDANGFKYAVPGYAISVQNKKGEVELDMILE